MDLSDLHNILEEAAPSSPWQFKSILETDPQGAIDQVVRTLKMRGTTKGAMAQMFNKALEINFDTDK